MTKANIALNAWNGISRSAKRFALDAQRTWRGDASFNNLTYILRNEKAKAAYRAAVRNGTADEFTYGPGSFSMGRVAAVGLGGYAVLDAVGRVASGGSVTRNASGRRDLVGLPLI
jgi:hypothetical protein